MEILHRNRCFEIKNPEEDMYELCARVNDYYNKLIDSSDTCGEFECSEILLRRRDFELECLYLEYDYKNGLIDEGLYNENIFLLQRKFRCLKY